MSDTATTWIEDNQRSLWAALARVQTYLERHAERDAERAGSGDSPGQTNGRAGVEDADGIDGAVAVPMALETLVSRCGLSPFERDILLLCAAVELDARVASLCAAAQGDPQRRYPTLGLALAALPEPHWSALTPDAPLRRWRLVDVVAAGPAEALTSCPLRIDERILHYLVGLQHLDERLEGLVEPASPTAQALTPSHRALAGRLTAIWARSAGAAGPWPAVQLWGVDRWAKRDVAAAAAAASGLALYVLPADVLPAAATEVEALRRLWEREAALGASALLLDCEAQEALDAQRLAAVTRFADQVKCRLVIAGREPLRHLQRPAPRLEVQPPPAAEQRAYWRFVLGDVADELEGSLADVAAQFRLSTRAIRAAAAETLDSHATETGRSTETLDVRTAATEDLAARLWEACRTQARLGLDDLAQRIIPAATWDDLVLPETQRSILSEIAAHVRHRTTVHEGWGFAARGGRGLGITALFAGVSGTGKTMAAEVLAADLRLDLYRIDLSAVVSKYIGETEKNLRRVFDAAEESGAILLFDEADALFGKRSEVKDSHDRYANIEVSYLLQRMESYGGLAILTTNVVTALDPAFLRRLRFVVQFPFPESAQRAEIWRRAFPPDTPTDGLDAARLARLSVAGGNIRTIALRAAFLAADAGKPVGMAHLLLAARGEYAKLEKPLTEAEVGGWV